MSPCPHQEPCASRQDQKILLSIYNISMSLREAGTLRGPEELALGKVVRNTDFVLRQNCRRFSKVRDPSQSPQGLPAPQHAGCGQSLPCLPLS